MYEYIYIIILIYLKAERELGLARHLLKCEAWKPLLEEAPANQWRWPIN